MAKTRIYNVTQLPTICEAGATYFVNKGTYVEEYRTSNTGVPFIVGNKEFILESVGVIPDHVQNTPSTTWIVNHNTGRKRSLEFFTTGGVRIRGDVVIVNDNQSIGYFLEPIAGFAKII
jgi:hypothetical protein